MVTNEEESIEVSEIRAGAECRVCIAADGTWMKTVDILRPALVLPMKIWS